MLPEYYTKYKNKKDVFDKDQFIETSSNSQPTEGSGSSVSIATVYGLDGPGIEYWWQRDFPHLSRPALSPTQPPVRWVPGLSRG